MSERKTHLMTIYFIGNKGEYKNYKDAVKVADALKNKLEYIKKTNKEYFINAFIGISNLNIRHGSFKYKETKSTGKNVFKIVPKNKYKGRIEECIEPWHLHILIEANPAETIGEIIVDYLNKKFDRKIAQKKKIDNGFFTYALKQSRYQRFVTEKRDTKLVKYDFKDLYDRHGKPKTKIRKNTEKRNIQKLEKRSWIKHAERLLARKQSLNSLEKIKCKNAKNTNNSNEITNI